MDDSRDTFLFYGKIRPHAVKIFLEKSHCGKPPKERGLSLIF